MRRDNSTSSWKKVELRRVLNEIKIGTRDNKDDMASSYGSRHKYDNSVWLQLESPMKWAREESYN